MHFCQLKILVIVKMEHSFTGVRSCTPRAKFSNNTNTGILPLLLTASIYIDDIEYLNMKNLCTFWD